MVAPILSASAQAIGIDCCSNIIAQSLQCHQRSEPWHIDRTQLLRFALYACITAPLNFLWQALLERTFPKWVYERRGANGGEDVALEERGHHRARSGSGSGSRPRSGSRSGWRRGAGRGDEVLESYESSDADTLLGVDGGDGYTRRRNKRNIFLKWFCDCITGGAILNTTAFLVIMGLLKGKGPGEIAVSMREETLSIIFNSYKIWPVASVINFTFIPVEKRIVFLSCCGLLWNIYLSIVAARV